MRIRFHRSKVVDSNNFDVLAIRLGDGSQYVAADAPKAVDGNPN
jgi:hypothetical protein